MAGRNGAPDPGSAIVETWTDAWGGRRTPSLASRRAVLEAMRPGLAADAAARDPVRLARPGARLGGPGEVVLEDGTSLGTRSTLPRDVPHGYHRLRSDAGELLLIVAPQRCHLPDELRGWGWAVQLYAARSRRSWGIGDLDDLRRLARWSASLGAEALLVNPLGAPNPGPEPEPSPYYPSSRRFRSPLYLALERVPGYQQLAEELAPLAREARAANRQPFIDRPAVLVRKMAALERLWAAGAAASGEAPGSLARFTAEQGDALRLWGIFVALTELHGPGWTTWPAALRDPGSDAVGKTGAQLAERVAFHAWIQWLIDRQLADAAGHVALIGDLPVGFDPGGFDAWCWQGQLAAASVGAPPDIFNPDGQNWGLPPFVPHLLRAGGYAPFIETVRAAMAHAGGLRIDHVLGLFRQWWVPAGAAPADGAYVRQPAAELLAILAIESHRAGAIVVGEDLGTVEPGVRRRLAAAQILSTRLAYFERKEPAAWPREAIAAITTHDLPTVVGAWTGADLEDQAAAGVAPDVAGLRWLRRRLARFGRIAGDPPLPEVVETVHRALAGSRSALAFATLDDALLVARRPNIPGTDATQRANWSLALPKSLEGLRRDPFVGRIAATMRDGRRRPAR